MQDVGPDGSSDSPTPAGALSDGGSGVMFDRIARRYDLLNRLMSLGLDRRWRRRLVAVLAPAIDQRETMRGETMRGKATVLDLASGTGDVAVALAEVSEHVRVVGIDPSSAMLQHGRTKLAKRPDGRICLLLGDGQQLPLADNACAASCIAFGIRNVPDRVRCLEEMRRVTRPGGVVAVLELAEPRRGLLAPLTRWHVRTVVPRLGAWLSGSREYRYLQQSMAAFPSAEAFAELMRDSGVVDVRVETMGLGAVHLFSGRVSADPSPLASFRAPLRCSFTSP